MPSFETFDFDPAFTVEVEPEFPGDGDWQCPVVGFDRNGRVMAEFGSRWGTPFVARIRPRSASEWIAMFAAGGLGSLRSAFATPAPQFGAVLADSLAYLVDVMAPGAPATVVGDQVHQVVPCSEPPLLRSWASSTSWRLAPPESPGPRPGCASTVLRSKEPTLTGFCAPATTLAGRQRSLSIPLRVPS